MSGFDDLKWGDNGLLPAIAQDMTTKQVLMLAWMNEEALRMTLQTGEVHFWSRSREELWRKGASSGNVLVVSDVFYDCDADAILVRVWPNGPACHTGNTSCFYRELTFEDAISRTPGTRGVGPIYCWSSEAAEGDEGVD